GQTAAEVMPVASHGERGGANAAAEVEGKHLRTLVATELKRHQREQHGLASARGANDKGVADIADMKGKPERGRSLGLAVKQGGRTEMLVPFRPRPHGAEGDHVGKVERRDGRLTDVRIGVSGQ